jgi:hypothetical protein
LLSAVVPPENPWFPIVGKSGIVEPATVQKFGPKTALVSAPTWVRSP